MAILNIIPGLDQRNIHEVNLGGPTGGTAGGGGGHSSDNSAMFSSHGHEGNMFSSSGLSFEDYDPFIRDVTDEELVENRLTGLLNSDSKYIRQARRRGAEASAARGGLNSSLFAGASERAAIEAALPIAESDAQAFRQAAMENSQHINNNILGRLDAARSLAIANTSASASVQAARIGAEANERIAEMRINAEENMMEAGFGHDMTMENLRQDHRVGLEELGFEQQQWLTERGIEHDFAMSDLSQENQIEFEEMFGQPRWEAEMEQAQSNFGMNLAYGLMGMFNQNILAVNGMDIDDAARDRAYGTTQNFFTQFMDYFGLMGNDDVMGDMFGGGD